CFAWGEFVAPSFPASAGGARTADQRFGPGLLLAEVLVEVSGHRQPLDVRPAVRVELQHVPGVGVGGAVTGPPAAEVTTERAAPGQRPVRVGPDRRRVHIPLRKLLT